MKEYIKEEEQKYIIELECIKCSEKIYVHNYYSAGHCYEAKCCNCNITYQQYNDGSLGYTLSFNSINYCYIYTQYQSLEIISNNKLIYNKFCTDYYSYNEVINYLENLIFK